MLNVQAVHKFYLKRRIEYAMRKAVEKKDKLSELEVK